MSSEPKTSDINWLEPIFRMSPDGIVVQDEAGKILKANDRFGKLCNKPLEEIIGWHFIDLLCPESQANWNRNFEKLIRNEWSNIDGTFIFTGGRKIPIEVTLMAPVSEHGKNFIILHVRDTSVYHTVENALMASQNEWELSFNAISNAMWILDRKGRILRANQAALKKISAAAADPIGVDFFEIHELKHNASSIAEFRSKLYSEPQEIPRIEFSKIEGKYSLFSYPIKNSSGETSGCLVLIEDITEQVRQEEILKKIEIKRQRNSRIEALGRMAGGIAHDFNNILTTLLGYISLVLQSDHLGQNERTNLVEILHTVERGTALTRQLFEFSTEKKPNLKAINLNSVIQNMQKMLINICGPKIRIANHLDQQLWNINADVSRIERIITNLATNSRDAMPGGGELSIETANTVLDGNFCKNHPELKPGNYVLLQVCDTGFGIPPEAIERIYEPFFTTKKSGKGTGLGLASVFGIVRQFGGEIICYSEMNKGTTFKIYLPQSFEKAQEEAKPGIPAELPGGSETILIVDDEVHIVSMLNQILAKIGYKIISATNSTQAIARAKEHQGNIDLVLSDVIMPDMNGMELLNLLRENRPEVKAIFMSGYTNSMAIDAVGMDANTVFLQKPFTFEDLAKKIRSCIDRKAS
ncbi:MAG: response regulator [Kiritimatiellia bacterium]